MSRLPLIYRILVGIAEELEAAANLYNQESSQAFAQAYRFLKSAGISVHPYDCEKNALFFQVMPFYDVSLSEEVLLIGYSLKIMEGDHSCPIIVESFPTLGFSLAASQDQALALLLHSILQEWQELTQCGDPIFTSQSFFDLSSEQFRLLLSLLKTTITSP